MGMTRTARDFAYVVIMPKHRKQWEVDRWCVEQFGPRWSAVSNRAGVWCCFWIGTRAEENSGKYEWLFEREADAILFSLRWL